MIYLLVGLIAFAIMCRACRMDAHTPPRVVVQHSATLLLVVTALPEFGFGQWSAEILGAALGVYLLADARRAACPRRSNA